MNSKGEGIVPCLYDSVEQKGGLWELCRDGKTESIDSTRKTPKPQIRDRVDCNVAQDVRAECIDGKWGITDSEGRRVTSFEYDVIIDIGFGLVIMGKDGTWGEEMHYDGGAYPVNEVYSGKWECLNTTNNKTVFSSISGRAEKWDFGWEHFVTLKDGFVYARDIKYSIE
ncbi:MAG: hypothetical protein FWF10_11085 [Clostridiales bacterium]|nr:hypothetical protein [Clostridiales bacterium]